MSRFLFAINTISMVKNDALFSYVAPGNILAWACLPLRYCLSMKQFVWLNRAVIKCTHFPLLFCIYVYEKYYLAPYMYEPTDLVENPGLGRHRSMSFADPGRANLFSPSVRVREESVVGYQKDRALEEVFRRVPDMATLRTQRRNERRKTQNAIRSWMDQHDGGYHSPQNYSTIDGRIGNEWQRRLSMTRDLPRRYPRQVSDVRSAASDPADFISDAPYSVDPIFYHDGVVRRDSVHDAKDQTDGDGDGDDELVTNDEDEEDNATNRMGGERGDLSQAIEEDYFTTPIATRFNNSVFGSTATPQHKTTAVESPRPATARRAPQHKRTLSTNTILYAPSDEYQPQSSSSASPGPSSHPRSRPLSMRPAPTSIPATPAPGRRSLYVTARPRSTLPHRDMARTAPNRMALALDIPARKAPGRRRSSFDLDASSELNAAMAVDESLGAVPSSFTTQMAMATAMLGKSLQDDDSSRMSRLMLAKMKTLEESLGDVVREMRVLRSTVPSTAQNSGDEASFNARKAKMPFASGPLGASGSLGSPGPAVFEIAGRERGSIRRAKTLSSRTPERKPLSRRSTREWIGPSPRTSSGFGREKRKSRTGKGLCGSGDGSSSSADEPAAFGKMGSPL